MIIVSIEESVYRRKYVIPYILFLFFYGFPLDAQAVTWETYNSRFLYGHNLCLQITTAGHKRRDIADGLREIYHHRKGRVRQKHYGCGVGIGFMTMRTTPFLRLLVPRLSYFYPQ